MSLVSSKKHIGSKSSYRRLLTSDSIRSKKSQHSESFTSEYGSKFGRSVSKFPKQNDPGLVQSVSIVNSRVIRTFTNFPVKINSKLPDLMQMEATDCIRELGSFMNILDYEFNYTSFWILDILSKLIKHMQLKGLSVINQNICLMWFRFVLRCISVSGDSREEIFCLLQKMFLKAEESIKSGDPMPQPEEINIIERRSTKLAAGDIGNLLSSKSLHSISSRQSRKRLSQKSSKSPRKSSLISHTSNRSQSSKSLKSNAKQSFEDKVEINLQTLYSIVEMIYNVFADRFIFSLISQTYSSPTIVTPVEIPIEFKDPKLLRPTLVVTPPISPSSKKTSASKPGKKGKDKGKGKRKGSPSSRGESEADGKTDDQVKDTKSKKGKNKEKDESAKKGQGKGGKGKKKSKPSIRDYKEEASESNDQPKEKGKEKGGKGKKKSKPSLGDRKEKASESNNQPKEKGKEKGGKTKQKFKSSEDNTILHENKENTDTKNTNATLTKSEKSSSLERLQNIQIHKIEEQLKLFDRTAVAPEMKLEIKKIEVKDKFILPLSEGVRKDYVENLIKSLLPPETKPTDNANVAKGKSQGKSRKSSSLKGKNKKNSKADKKGKGKKK